MARPQKIGLDYFPFDVDFFSDRKIKVLFARFGCEGVAFYLYILCEIYRDKGFFVRCDDEFLEVASAELQIDRETLVGLLDFMVERQLVHGELFREFGVLTSRGIQARYQRAKENAGRKTPISIRGELWLLGPRETSACILARGEEQAACKDGRGTGGEPSVRESRPGKGTPSGRGSGGAKKPGEKGDTLTGATQITDEGEAESVGTGGVPPGAGLRPKAGSLPDEAGPVGGDLPAPGKSMGKTDGPHGEPGVASVQSEAEPASMDGQAAGPGGENPGIEAGALGINVSLIEKQCISVENSGGKNPQRKRKKRKGEEKGGGAAKNRVGNPSGAAGAPLSKTPMEKKSLTGGVDEDGQLGNGDSIHWAVALVRGEFASVPKNCREEIEGFLRGGAPPELIRYAVGEAKRLGKPYSYMAAIVRQRLAEGRLDVGGGKAPPSYDLEAFEKLGFHVPKFPKKGGGAV